MSAPDNTQNPVAGSPAKLCAVTAGMDIQFFKEGPGKPQINSAEDMNVLVAILRSLVNMQITRGDSDKVIISDGNWVIQIAQDLTKLTQLSGGGGPTAQQYRLKSVQGDYVTCHTWDGTTEGSTNVLVAKEWWLRNSLATATIFSQVHNYTYGAGPDGNNIFRTNANASTGESQVEMVLQPWTVNELIYALPVDHTGVTVSGVELTLLMDGRTALWSYPAQ